MITADLDAELARSVRALTSRDDLPATGGSWRPAPGGDPTRYVTSAALEAAGLIGHPAAEVAAALGTQLRSISWIERAEPSSSGYLTVTVTGGALAALARRIPAAGPGCVRSSILAGTTAELRRWPDPAAAGGWEQTWHDQADAMVGQLATAAGAVASQRSEGERVVGHRTALRTPDWSVAAAVEYYGVDVVRYALSRATPHGGVRLLPARLENVLYAHAAARSTMRWAGDLGIACHDPGDQLAGALATAAERELLGALSWLPVRVASAARRRRPDELPRYLERLALGWTTCQELHPALPFGGVAAARDEATVSARLMLAAATATGLAAGLALAGIAARDQI